MDVGHCGSFWSSLFLENNLRVRSPPLELLHDFLGEAVKVDIAGCLVEGCFCHPRTFDRPQEE